MGNRERIVQATIALMSEQGSSVGTTQLARHLGISPGNLYYHFANREEILAEILRRLQAELDLALDAGIGPMTAQRLAGALAGGVLVLWRYRFFFSSALELVVHDAQLRRQYAAICERGVGQLDILLARARSAHASSERLDARMRRRLVENVWVLWASWPRHVEVTAPDGASESAILRCHEHIALLIRPYLAGDFFEIFQRHVRRQLARRQGSAQSGDAKKPA